MKLRLSYRLVYGGRCYPNFGLGIAMILLVSRRASSQSSLRPGGAAIDQPVPCCLPRLRTFQPDMANVRITVARRPVREFL